MKKSARETKHERLWIPGNKLRVIVIKEDMCCDEHWMLNTANESLNTTSKTNDVLYAG